MEYTTSNVGMKYAHTKGGGGISLSFWNAGISVSRRRQPVVRGRLHLFQSLNAVRLRASLLLAALALVGCQLWAADLLEAAAQEGIEREQVVLLDNAAVAARINHGAVELILFSRVEDQWTSTTVNSHPAGETANSGHLLSYGGAAGDEWNSFFYGTAAPDVALVRVQGLDTTGGEVRGGTWVIAIQQRDIHPDDLIWSFVDQDGRVVQSGTGVFPPEA